MAEMTNKGLAPIERIHAALDGARPTLARIAAKGVDPERIIGIVRREIVRNPDLLKCDPKTIVFAAMGAAEYGLSPSSVTGQCYLVPFGGVCQLMLGYRGMIDIACRSGMVKAIYAMPVFTDDEFSMQYGSEPIIRHVPNDESQRQGWADLRLAYAVAFLGDGVRVQAHVGKRELDALKSKQARRGGPWRDDPIPMASKTAIRRLFKFLPTIPAVAYQLGREDALERGEDMPEPEYVDPPAPAETGSKAERVVAALEGKAAAESAAAALAGVSPVTVEDVDAAFADGETDDTMF